MRLDTLIVNARIRTGCSKRPSAERIGIWRGRVVGVDEQLDTFRSIGALPEARNVLDAGGAAILPGFNDAHAHSVWFGQTLMETDLSNVRRAEDVYTAIAGSLTGLGPADWAVCSNFNPLQMSDALDRDALDSSSRGRPVLIKHASGHAFTVNGVALQLAGITDRPDSQPEGGLIETDAAGRATGLLEENAMRAVQRLVQPESLRHIGAALDAATRHYLSEGITSVTDAGVAGGWIGHSPVEFAAYQDARDAGMLHTRVQAMITMDALHTIKGHAEDPTLRTLDAGVRSGLGDARLQVGPVKVFTDGSLLGATAAMTKEYSHCRHNHGYLQGDPEAMRTSVVEAAGAGWTLALHAIGDAALDFALDTITEARTTHPRPQERGAGGAPDRIEHGGVVREDQIDRMAALGVVLVPQPLFIGTFGDGMARNLGPDRTSLSYPARRLLDAGITLPGSSDRPVAHGAPLAVMQAFVERLTETGADYSPAERISVDEAVAAYTTGSAEVTGWGAQKGKLIEGYLADLVVLDDDPASVASSEISGIGVRATMVDGELVHGELLGQ